MRPRGKKAEFLYELDKGGPTYTKKILNLKPNPNPDKSEKTKKKRDKKPPSPPKPKTLKIMGSRHSQVQPLRCY